MLKIIIKIIILVSLLIFSYNQAVFLYLKKFFSDSNDFLNYYLGDGLKNELNNFDSDKLLKLNDKRVDAQNNNGSIGDIADDDTEQNNSSTNSESGTSISPSGQRQSSDSSTSPSSSDPSSSGPSPSGQSSSDQSSSSSDSTEQDDAEWFNTRKKELDEQQQKLDKAAGSRARFFGRVLNIFLPGLIVFGGLNDMRDIYMLFKKSRKAFKDSQKIYKAFTNLDGTADGLKALDNYPDLLKAYNGIKNSLSNFSKGISYSDEINKVANAWNTWNKAVKSTKPLPSKAAKLISGIDNMGKSDDMFKLANLVDAGGYFEVGRTMKFNRARNAVKAGVPRLVPFANRLKNFKNSKRLVGVADDIGKLGSEMNKLSKMSRSTTKYTVTWFRSSSKISNKKIDKVIKLYRSTVNNVSTNLKVLYKARKAAQNANKTSDIAKLTSQIDELENLQKFLKTDDSFKAIIKAEEMSEMAKSGKSSKAAKAAKAVDTTIDTSESISKATSKGAQAATNIGSSNINAISSAVGSNNSAVNKVVSTTANSGSDIKNAAKSSIKMFNNPLFKKSKANAAKQLNNTIKASIKNSNKARNASKATTIVSNSNLNVTMRTNNSIVTKSTVKNNVVNNARNSAKSIDKGSDAAKVVTKTDDIVDTAKIASSIGDAGSDAVKASSKGVNTAKKGSTFFKKAMSKLGPAMTIIGFGVCMGMAGAHRTDSDAVDPMTGEKGSTDPNSDAQNERNEMYLGCFATLLLDLAIDFVLGLSVGAGTALALGLGTASVAALAVVAWALVAFMITSAIMDMVDDCTFNRPVFGNYMINTIVTGLKTQGRQGLFNSTVDNVTKAALGNVDIINMQILLMHFEILKENILDKFFSDNYWEIVEKNDKVHEYSAKSETDLNCKVCGFSKLSPQHFPYHKFEAENPNDEHSECKICKVNFKNYDCKTKYAYQHFEEYGCIIIDKNKDKPSYQNKKIFIKEGKMEIIKNKIDDASYLTIYNSLKSQYTANELNFIKKKIIAYYNCRDSNCKFSDPLDINDINSDSFDVNIHFKYYVDNPDNNILDNLLEIKSNFNKVISEFEKTLNFTINDILNLVYPGKDASSFINDIVMSALESQKYASPKELSGLNLNLNDQIDYFKYLDEYFNINRIYVPNLSDKEIMNLIKIQKAKERKRIMEFLGNLKFIKNIVSTISTVIENQELQITNLSNINNIRQQRKESKVYNIQVIKYVKQQQQIIELNKIINKKRITNANKEIARIELLNEINTENLNKIPSEILNKMIDDYIDDSYEKKIIYEENANLLNNLSNLDNQNNNANIDTNDDVNADNNFDNDYLYDGQLTNENPKSGNVIIYIIIAFTIVVIVFFMINFVLNKLTN